MPLAREQFPGMRLVFVEDAPSLPACNGHPVMAYDMFVEQSGARLAIAVADPATRRSIAARAIAAKIEFVSILASDLRVMDDVSWGTGCIFSPGVTVTSNIRIGDQFHCNLHAYVEHDCSIGDYVTFGPGVRCNGAVTIGDNVYVGSGAMIRQGITIGAGATIGMGAVVVKDVMPNAVVGGNPARPLRTH